MMKTYRKYWGQILFVVMFCAYSARCLPVWADDVTEPSVSQGNVLDGWQKQEGKSYYYLNGEIQTGLLQIGEAAYYFLPGTGEMQTGLQKIEGAAYYFDPETGMMQTGLQKIEGAVYCFDPETGVMQTGLQKIEGAAYYFDPETGVMQTGLQKIEGAAYYFDPETGVMQTGLQKIAGDTYYFHLETGVMQTGRQSDGENAYYFNEDGTLETSGWIDADGSKYYSSQSGVLYEGRKKIGGKYYYFSPDNHKMLTGWQKIAGKKYYFTPSGAEKGAMQKNCIAGTKKAGYYYVDANGVQVTSAEVKKAVKFVTANTKLSKSKNIKLRECFDALWKSCTYQRFYESPTAKDMPGYADYMFTNKKGNCFRYASCFAYIAKVLGFESRVCIGSISSARGGMTPHGWTEVKAGGVWYMCDANMQRNHPNKNSYMRTEASYPYRHTRSKTWNLQIKKGRVSWK